MSDECRYLFTVRQRFGEEPVVDTFYKIQVPSGLTGDQAQVMRGLKNDFCEDEMSADTQALNGIQMRLRFNSDMYPNVCMVRTESEIDAEMLDLIVLDKHRDGELMNWLKESEI